MSSIFNIRCSQHTSSSFKIWRTNSSFNIWHTRNSVNEVVLSFLMPSLIHPPFIIQTRYYQYDDNYSMDKIYTILLLPLIFILHLKEQLAILNGELHVHCAYLKNFPVMPDVVVDEVPVDGLMMHPDLALHC
jgi:hypothetical protein